MTVLCQEKGTSESRQAIARGPLLHLGCGTRLHPAWCNLDLRPRHASVVRHDVRAPLPFPAHHFTAVYHSHLLEHLPREEARRFLGECRRVLRAGGVLRVVVPDLEQIARLYLESLEGALAGDVAWQQRHEWLLLELFDQVGREKPGGAMADYLRRAERAGLAFARERLGAEVEAVRKDATNLGFCSKPRWLARLRGWFSLRGWRERCLRWLLGDEYGLLQRARFRAGGEVHRAMYDRYSLVALLKEASFVDVEVADPGESRIAGWAEYRFERDADGNVLKPDSLHVEGIAP